MNQIQIISVQTLILILNKKIKIFYKSYNRKEDNNSVQNNHRRFNRCRFKVFLA